MEKLTGKRLFMLTFGIMMSLVVFGQQVRVSGTVTDAADRQTLPGVNVLVKGSLTGLRHTLIEGALIASFLLPRIGLSIGG
ncbi:MAG TPA: hypothetical protein PKE28_01295, partial [Bacteroidales bacterium]|nr:hypothetical protein [Bacteroidales bacterium]